MKGTSHTYIARTRNGLIYRPMGEKLPKGWKRAMIRTESVLDVAAAIGLAALLAGGMLLAVIGAIWLLGKAGVL